MRLPPSQGNGRHDTMLSYLLLGVGCTGMAFWIVSLCHPRTKANGGRTNNRVGGLLDMHDYPVSVTAQMRYERGFCFPRG